MVYVAGVNVDCRPAVTTAVAAHTQRPPTMGVACEALGVSVGHLARPGRLALAAELPSIRARRATNTAMVMLLHLIKG